MNRRLIGAALAVVVLFLAGWTVRGWKADSDIAALVQAHTEERAARQAAASAAVAKAESDGRDAAVKYEAKIRDISTTSQRLRSELRNAETAARNSGTAVCLLTPEWVRLYDAALRPGGDPGTPSGEPAGSSQGAGASDPGAAPTSEWDVAWVHAENASRWAECRAQLNALIDFSLGDGKAVVTP